MKTQKMEWIGCHAKSGFVTGNEEWIWCPSFQLTFVAPQRGWLCFPRAWLLGSTCKWNKWNRSVNLLFLKCHFCSLGVKDQVDWFMAVPLHWEMRQAVQVFSPSLDCIGKALDRKWLRLERGRGQRRRVEGETEGTSSSSVPHGGVEENNKKHKKAEWAADCGKLWKQG